MRVQGMPESFGEYSDSMMTICSNDWKLVVQGSHFSGDMKFHVFSRLFPVKAMKSQVNLASNHSVGVDNLDIR